MQSKDDTVFSGANARGAELLAPAGDLATALAAFEAGADAVYCGLDDFSARAFAANFTVDDLKNLVGFARAAVPRRRVYVTFNTVIDEGDMERAVERLAELEEIGPDALIVQDLGVARLCRRSFPRLAIHASTQLAAHNLEGVIALKEAGFARVVLARELSAAEIAAISKRCGVELEVFIHGALCYSVSGLCLFSAMEKGRSGNRGRCAYCCRMPYADSAGRQSYPFSMKDLRVGEGVRRLVAAGAASLKIEGRMKSALYVASVVRWYRQILDPALPKTVAPSDLETVFSRRTTPLFLDGRRDDVIDGESLGHLGANVGTVKRVTKDREGRSWLRFHTSRALERHDGLQFSSPDGGKPAGFGISEMRQAISRTGVYSVPAGTDVEILLPEGPAAEPLLAAVKPGATVYCSMSNAVKRMFPAPAFRPSDYPGVIPVCFRVSIAEDGVDAEARMPGLADGEPAAKASARLRLDPAKTPDRTRKAVENAFSRLGGTDYRFESLELCDVSSLFVPASVLNDLRRELVEKLDDARAAARRAKVASALDECCGGGAEESPDAAGGVRRVKLRLGQKLPRGDWAEVVALVDAAKASTPEAAAKLLAAYGETPVRLALGVFTPEADFARLRVLVKRLAHAGWTAWEAADLAGLHMLRAAGIEDITADWTLYAFNSAALAELSAMGVRRFVASPENCRENLVYLAESGYDVEFLVQQTTPLFISLHRPLVQAADENAEIDLKDSRGESLFARHSGALWTTAMSRPRTFNPPSAHSSVRIDLSWDREEAL